MSEEKKSVLLQYLELQLRRENLKGKKEIVDKYSNAVEQTLKHEKDTFDLLVEHQKKESNFLLESSRTFAASMAKREQNAKEFCKDKTCDELKDYLADQPVAYNLWKNADYDTLVKLTMEVYEDEMIHPKQDIYDIDYDAASREYEEIVKKLLSINNHWEFFEILNDYPELTERFELQDKIKVMRSLLNKETKILDEQNKHLFFSYFS
jgi:hypothetical protein